MRAFTARRLISPTATVENPVVLLEDSKDLDIASLSARSVPAGVTAVDFGGSILAPGYVDLSHSWQRWIRPLPGVERLLVRHGVTSYYPTKAPMAAILRALERLAGAIEQGARSNVQEARACPVGIHLEGPFLSHARRGVHPPEGLLKPTLATFERFWQAARQNSHHNHRSGTRWSPRSHCRSRAAVFASAEFTGRDLAHTIAAASRNPTRVSRLTNTRLTNKGESVAGADNDFVVLNSGEEVMRMLVGGVEG